MGTRRRTREGESEGSQDPQVAIILLLVVVLLSLGRRRGYSFDTIRLDWKVVVVEGESRANV